MIGVVSLPVGIFFGVMAALCWHYFDRAHRWVPLMVLVSCMGINTTFAGLLSGALGVVTGLVGTLGGVACAIVIVHDFHWRKHATKMTILAAFLLPLLVTGTGVLGHLLEGLAHLANSFGTQAGKL